MVRKRLYCEFHIDVNVALSKERCFSIFSELCTNIQLMLVT